MTKVISQMMVSVDGFYEGKNHDLNWHKVDAEHNEYAVDLFDHTSAIIFGRKTYQVMEKYWPTEDSQEVAEHMNHLPKVVFSKTLKDVSWNETTLVKDQVKDYITALKNNADKDLLIIGSGELVSYLTAARLIDEYHIIISPIFLGEGKKFLKYVSGRIPLNLVRTKTFKTGNILLCYQLTN